MLVNFPRRERYKEAGSPLRCEQTFNSRAVNTYQLISNHGNQGRKILACREAGVSSRLDISPKYMQCKPKSY